MPFNGSGTFAIINTFVPNTTILSASVNQNFTDIASGLTDCLTRDNQAGMLDVLRAVSGAIGAPGLTFGSDTTSGMYLNATGQPVIGAGATFGAMVNGAGFAATAAVVNTGGSNYAVGDQISLSGGTYLLPIVLTVATLSGSAVATATVTDGGRYFAKPSDPVSQASTTGAGSGANFNITWTSAKLINDDAGASLLQPLGLSSYMASIMGSQSAAALNTALAGTIIFPTSLSTTQNNYAPTGYAGASTIYLTSSTGVTITGILSTGSVNGRILVLENYGAYNFVLTAQDSNSTASNRFAFPRAYTLRPNQAISLQWDNGVTTGLAGWRVRNPVVTLPIPGGFKNLQITNSGVTPNSIMLLTADYVTVSSALGDTMRIASPSLSINSSTSGANGLDTGTVTTSTWYAIYVIYNPTTNTTAGLFSTSATSPTLPSGYTYYNRLGWNVTDGSSNFKRIIQYGARVQYIIGANPTGQISLISGVQGSVTVPTWVAASVSGAVPSTAAEISVTLINYAGSDACMAAPNGSYPRFDNALGPPLSFDGNSSVGAGLSARFVLESTNVYYASAVASAGLVCNGWIDNL